MDDEIDKLKKMKDIIDNANEKLDSTFDYFKNKYGSSANIASMPNTEPETLETPGEKQGDNNIDSLNNKLTNNQQLNNNSNSDKNGVQNNPDDEVTKPKKEEHNLDPNAAENCDGDNTQAAQDLKDGFGKDAFAKTLNDPDYYQNKQKELDEKAQQAKDEINNPMKEVPKKDDKKDADKNDSADNSKDNQNSLDNATNRDNKERNPNNEKNSSDNKEAKDEDPKSEKKDDQNDDSKGDNKETELKNKNKFDRLKDKANYGKAKVDSVKNKIDSKKAKAYQATHPVEAAKAKTKAKVEKKKKEVKEKVRKKVVGFIMRHPIECLIAAAIILVIFLILILVIGLAGSDKKLVFNRGNNFERVYVDFDDDDIDNISVSEYAFSVAFTRYFLKDELDEISPEYSENDSESQKHEKLLQAQKNAFFAYYLYVKSRVLKNEDGDTFNILDKDYAVSPVGNYDLCSPVDGCDDDTWWFIHTGGHSTFTCDEDDEDCEPDNPGIFDIADDKEHEYNEIAKLIVDNIDELDNLVITSKEYSDVLITDSSMIVFDVDEIGYKTIRDKVNENKDYKTAIIEINDDIDLSNPEEAANANTIIYDVEPIIKKIDSVGGGGSSSSISYAAINSNYHYVDQGFYWPIGADCTKKNGVEFCEGVPSLVSVSSPFGYRVTDYGVEEGHDGIDIPGYTSTPIVAINDGYVERIYCMTEFWKCNWPKKGNDPYYGGGCQVHINHGNGIVSKYLHLQVGSYPITIGAEVKRGQKIGMMGTTGCSTGEHLHFAILDNGIPINPLNYVSQGNTRPAAKKSV